MSRWALLLRGVNVGGRNTLRMADLRGLLEGLGHTEVRTHLNSGNATFSSARRRADALASEVEAALAEQLALPVRAVVLGAESLRTAVEATPADLEGYVLVCVPIGTPDAEGVQALQRWSPEVVRPGQEVLYLAYPDMRSSRLTPAVLERHLGVPATSRTPQTLRRMLR